jgi:membrane associated rhomboid family serine protease
MKCPRCPVELENVAVHGHSTHRCKRCQGLWFEAGELAKFNHFDSDFPLRPDSSKEGETTPSLCPHCKSLLAKTAYAPGGSLDVQRCNDCKGVWLDGHALKQIRSLLAKKLIRTRQMRQLDTTIRREQEKWEDYTARVAEDESKEHVSKLDWWFMFLTHLPVEVHNPVRRLPEVTIAICLVNIIVFVLQSAAAPSTIAAFEFVPGNFHQLSWFYTILTAMFIHGSVAHLTGNLYFLYTFGDNVEDFLGPLQFTVLYFLCGIAANLTHFASNMHSTIPALGASGAISGIFAAYILLYPRRRIYFLVLIVPVKIRAIWYGIGWMALQLVSAVVMNSQGIAWWAHIGGFATGLVLVEGYLRYRHVHPATAFA